MRLVRQRSLQQQLLHGKEPSMDDTTHNTPPAGGGNAGDKKSFRKAFRVPISDSYALTVRVGEENFGAFDVVEGGVGIFHSRRAAFSVGQELEAVTLFFRGEPMALSGRVVHVSRDDRGMIRYGVEFSNLDEDLREQLDDFVRIARKEYFEHLDDAEPEL